MTPQKLALLMSVVAFVAACELAVNYLPSCETDCAQGSQALTEDVALSE